MAHSEWIRPSAAITIRNGMAYRPPRISAQPISPAAMSPELIGVASAESYSLAYLSRKKTLKVESITAPFMAEVASRAGATKLGKLMSWPPTCTLPTRAPIPTPMDSR